MNEVARDVLRVIEGLAAICALLLGCTVRYLTAPPKEFYEFIDSVPTPEGAFELGAKTELRPAPKEVCTEIQLVRLYGAQESYRTVLNSFRDVLEEGRWSYLTLPGEDPTTTFLLDEHTYVCLYETSADDTVNQRRFGERLLRDAEQSYEALFVMGVGRSYGNCGPNPNWPQE